MRNWWKKLGAVTAAASLGAAALVGFPASLQQAEAASTNIVISEVYGGGGNSGAVYDRDFIELYNLSDAPVDVTGWNATYYSANGNAQEPIAKLTGIVQPGDYFLIGAAHGNNTNLPTFEVDVDAGPKLGGSNGAIVLTDNAGATIDTVGYGSAVTNETASTKSLTNSTSASRTPVTQDTDNNSVDFTVGAPTPQKSGADPVETPTPTESPAPTETPTPTESPAPTETPGAITPIAEIQGTGAATPLEGQQVTTQGVVTAVYATGGKDGFYIQTPGAASADGPSTGVFVYSKSLVSSVTIGDSVEVTGTATEYYENTQVAASAVTKVDSLGAVEPLELAEWPADDEARERLEGMLVLPSGGTYTVADNYGLNRYGEIGLASGQAPLVQPTEVGTPGSAEAQAQVADNAARSVTLDDGSSWDYTKRDEAKNSPLPYLTLETPVTVGASATFTEPVVVDYGFDKWRLQPTQQVVGLENSPVSFSNVREAAPDAVGGDVTIGTFNVLNYFTTLGNTESGCKFYVDREGNPTTTNYCTMRGAYDEASFERQQAKIVAAINTFDASVIALEEIEDSSDFGQDRDAALAHLVDELNAAADGDKWAYVPSPDVIPATGDDVIRTAFIYQPAAVTYVEGSTEILDNPNFTNARAPLAATFASAKNPDAKFIVMANHFKSKGGSGADDNAAPKDPASDIGGWNGDRTRQAQALVEFADAQQSKQGTDMVFLTGDFNSYSMESPVRTIVDADYQQVAVDGEYSYLFGGLVGSLDHVFASPAAFDAIVGKDIWTINAYEPIALEYSRYNNNVTPLYAADPYRSSDHNPKIIGVDLPGVEEDAAPTGNLDVNYFSDRKVNNEYDVDGDLQRGSYIYVKDAAGQWWSTVPLGADKLGHLIGLAEGEAEVYVVMPNGVGQQVVFNTADLTRFEQLRMEAQTGVNYIDSDNSEITEGASISGGQAVAKTTVNITAGETASLEIGMSKVTAEAKTVEYGQTESAEGLATVEFGDGEYTPSSNWSSGRFLATESATDAGAYEFLNDTMSITPTPADGYMLTNVTAFDGRTELTVTETDGTYSVDRAALANEFSRVTWTVEVLKVSDTDLTLTGFRDTKVNNVFDEGVDQPLKESTIFVKDANGTWWTTTAERDGVFSLPGMAPGGATVYLPTTNGMNEAVYFNPATLERYEQAKTEQVDAVYYDPATGTYGAGGITGGRNVAVIPVTLPESGPVDLQVGTSRVSSKGEITVADNAVPVSDAVESVELNDSTGKPHTTWDPATGTFRGVASETNSLNHWFLDNNLSLTVTLKPGYEIVSVEAIAEKGTRSEVELDVTQAPQVQVVSPQSGSSTAPVMMLAFAEGEGPTSGTFYADRTQVPAQNSPVEWNIQVAQVADPEPTESPAPTETETETPAPTETETETPAPTETETETPAPTETETETPAPTETDDDGVIETTLAIAPESATETESMAGFELTGAGWTANTELSLVVEGPNGYRVEAVVMTDADGNIVETLTWATFDDEGNLIADNQRFPAGTYTATVTDGDLSQTVEFVVTADDAATSTEEPVDTDTPVDTTPATDDTTDGGVAIDGEKLPATGNDNFGLLAGISLATLAAGAVLVLMRRRIAE